MVTVGPAFVVGLVLSVSALVALGLLVTARSIAMARRWRNYCSLLFALVAATWLAGDGYLWLLPAGLIVLAAFLLIGEMLKTEVRIKPVAVVGLADFAALLLWLLFVPR